MPYNFHEVVHRSTIDDEELIGGVHSKSFRPSGFSG